MKRTTSYRHYFTRFCLSPQPRQLHTRVTIFERRLATIWPGISAPVLTVTQMSDIDLVDVAPQEILDLAVNGRNNSQFDGMMWSMPQRTTSTAITAPDHCMNSSNARPLGQSTSISTPPKTTTPDSQKEDALSMHYLDDVLYAQNTFYNPADKYKRA